MIEFFMSRPEADRYSREHGGEVYHHSSRKYWLVADKTAYGDCFLAAHPYVVTDMAVLDQRCVHIRYNICGLLPNGEWRMIPVRSKNRPEAEAKIEEYKLMMGLPGFPVYGDFRIRERTTILRQSVIVK